MRAINICSIYQNSKISHHRLQTSYKRGGKNVSAFMEESTYLTDGFILETPEAGDLLEDDGEDPYSEPRSRPTRGDEEHETVGNPEEVHGQNGQGKSNSVHIITFTVINVDQDLLGEVSLQVREKRMTELILIDYGQLLKLLAEKLWQYDDEDLN